MSSRARRWKLALFLVSLPIALVLTAWWWASSLIDRQWAEMEKRVRVLEGEARSRDPRRPVLRGDPIPGDAWEDYGIAIAEFRKRHSFSLQRTLVEFWNRTPKADAVQTEAILSLCRPAFEGVRQGVRRAEGQYPYSWGNLEWEIISDSPVGGLSQSFAVAAGCEARMLAQDGKCSEAIDLLLAIAQYGRDVGHNGILLPEMIGISVYWFAFDELRALIQSGKLNRAHLLEIDRALEILDKNFIRNGPCLRNEVLMIGQQTLKGNLKEIARARMGGAGLEGIRPTWRQLYSRKLLHANAFLILERWTARLATDDASFTEELRAWDEFKAAAAGNPLAAALVEGLSPHLAHRGRLATLRLVRVAAHYRATGEVPSLGDPFGTTLRHTITNGRLKVWSVWHNGVDDGGVGKWDSSLVKDLVLEVDR